jgi:hypothetical protein
MRIAQKALWSAAALPLAYHVLIGWGPVEAAKQAKPEAESSRSVATNPERSAYFGDLHLHTTQSFDAYIMMGTRTTPDDAYKFARGDAIDYLGQQVRRAVPLDFLAVTDHSENIGVFNTLEDPNSALSLSEIGKLAKQGGYANFLKVLAQIAPTPKGGASSSSQAANDALRDSGIDTKSIAASAWQRAIDAANANYQPGKFTTFIAYEWTSMPDNQNLHRNVIFRGDKAPAPFSRLDSEDPADLWTWLAKIRGQGYEALAIPHNANASNGLMYDWNTLAGRPIDEAYAQLRATNEPLSEISQNKGTSETHPLLSANDEFAGFEIWNKLLLGDTESRKPGSYWRDALGRGLVIKGKIGVNPYKDGAVGAGDLHNGLSVSDEGDYAGGANIGGAKRDKAGIEELLNPAPAGARRSTQSTVSSSGALTGVWAEANTRESIYAAFRRKETFATSGTRLKVRFFGGWDFAPALVKDPHWAKIAYRKGVPMGGDLPAATAGRAPRFAVQAVKDPRSGNLDRVQIVKVWLEGGAAKERVFDVAWSGNRTIDPKTGKLPAVGNTVDLKTGKYTNAIGAAQLATVWTDPTFKANQAAVYYVRVLEIPTPRWPTLRAIEYGLPIPKSSAPTLQERAWSSPIWYTPKV